MQISHTACIRSTPFFQSSSLPPSPSPPSQSPASGILLFDYSPTKSCNNPLPAKPNPPLPACSQRSYFHLYQWSQIHRYQLAPSEARLSERWEWEFHCYQLAISEARSTATSDARSTGNSLLLVKPDCPRSESEHSTATSEARSTANCLLPAKPDCQRGESEHSTTTSLLPVKRDPLLPAKPDPPLTACSQRRQIVREVRVSFPPLLAKLDPPLTACSQRSQIHLYHLAPSEATLSERWEWAFQSWSGSEYVRVVRVSMSELWEWACWSHESQSVHLLE